MHVQMYSTKSPSKETVAAQTSTALMSTFGYIESPSVVGGLISESDASGAESDFCLKLLSLIALC